MHFDSVSFEFCPYEKQEDVVGSLSGLIRMYPKRAMIMGTMLWSLVRETLPFLTLLFFSERGTPQDHHRPRACHKGIGALPPLSILHWEIIT